MEIDDDAIGCVQAAHGSHFDLNLVTLSHLDTHRKDPSYLYTVVAAS